MSRRCIAPLMMLPVLIAAWLTFSSNPVNGLPLSELAMFDLPTETEQVADAGPADRTEITTVNTAPGAQP